MFEPRLRWVRAYPEVPPPNRTWIEDHTLERITISNNAYGRALRALGGDFVLVEWDMALDPPRLQAFEQAVLDEPDRIWVAPYQLHNDRKHPMWSVWHVQPGRTDLAASVQAWEPLLPEALHQIAVAAAEHLDTLCPCYEPAQPGDRECNVFGFGCIWFPARVLEHAWLGDLDRELWYPMADSVFSSWCQDHGHRARICWECQPVHLHW
jgi:hypothetical protein